MSDRRYVLLERVDGSHMLYEQDDDAERFTGADVPLVGVCSWVIWHTVRFENSILLREDYLEDWIKGWL